MSLQSRILSGALALGSVAVLSGAAIAADGAMASKQAQSFLTDAIQGNLAEVAAGQMALQKSSNPDVKAFAQMMVDDHTKANNAAVAVANDISLTVPTEPSLTQRAKGKVMSALSGSAFDTMFVHDMVSGHKSDVKAYQAEAGRSDGEVSAYASNTLPVIQGHLVAVEKLSNELKAK